MKLALPLVSLLAVAWALWALARLPAADVPASVLAYLFAHFCWVGFGCYALVRVSPLDRAYLFIYFLPLVPAFAFALRVAGHYAGRWPLWLALAGGALQAAAIFIIVRHYFLRAFPALDALPVGTRLLLLESALFFLLGSALLVSLAAPGKPAADAIRAGLGLFWLAQGLFHFAFALGIVSNRMAWAARSEWAPSAIAIVIFCWLAVVASGQQAELSRAELIARAPAVVEVEP